MTAFDAQDEHPDAAELVAAAAVSIPLQARRCAAGISDLIRTMRGHLDRSSIRVDTQL